MPRKTLHSKERLLLVAVTVLLLLTPAFILPGTQRDEERQKEESVDPYSDWLDEDVVYIVTPEERSVFEKLTADEEKENFIEQFWRRRDPDPSTDFNEFKVEHYRRIAYANERYSNAGVSDGGLTGGASTLLSARLNQPTNTMQEQPTIGRSRRVEARPRSTPWKSGSTTTLRG